MARTYDEDMVAGFTDAANYDSQSLVSLVRDWSNRDLAALDDSIIKDSLRYAADAAYRDLKIAPLEHTIYYVLQDSTNSNIGFVSGSGLQGTLTTGSSTVNSIAQASLPIPADLVSYTHLRVAGKANSTNGSTWDVTNNGVISITATSSYLKPVFNEKVDVRTFYDLCATKTDSFFWTRHGALTLVAGYRLAAGDIIELHYHRRLPALYGRYNISSLVVTGDDTATETALAASPVVEELTAMTTPTDTVWKTNEFYKEGVNTITVNSRTFRGKLVPHWLRDENERIVLFGALAECFDYLDEMDQAQKYKQKFNAAIQELNYEDKMRTATGGNTAVNYSSYLI